MTRRAIIYVFALAICITACTKRPAVPDENAATRKAAELIQKYQLTSDRIECLDFEVTDEGADFLVRVRENHTPKCGGDPMVAPTLFFMKINKSDGSAATTDYDSENFLPLREPKQ
ncbi:hypothetical protein [Paraburkholderia flava]|uniref:hypothetical protein n=1 Tax=Paraburkholderia flava TaxID=2547393 RepID=UPI00105C8FB7|nr:hypothetical protein [Paraburkholderia flava]